MIQENPAIADDHSLDWKDRLVLFALNQEQAEDYYQGADPRNLILTNGQTLQQYLDQHRFPDGSLYFPLSAPCALFSLEAGNTQNALSLKARAEDLSSQGGSDSGCGIPDEATALMIQLRMESPTDNPVRVKLWSKDKPQPPHALIDNSSGRSDTTLAVIPISQTIEPAQYDLQLVTTGWTALEGLLIGYFSRYDGISSGGISLMKESTSSIENDFFGFGAGKNNSGGYMNAFFGYLAGNSNTIGYRNSVFGSYAGPEIITGYANSLFGNVAGVKLKSGDDNSFFGVGAGYSNVNSDDNSYFGSEAGRNATGWSNSFFGREAGFGYPYSSLNTGNYNSYFGRRAGFYNTTGSFNSFFGNQAGLSNSDGSKNAFFGYYAGKFNETGEENAFFGNLAGLKNTTNSFNAYFGSKAGRNATGQQNCYFGSRAGLGATSSIDNSGDFNSFFGFESGLLNTSGHRNAFHGYQTGQNNREGSFNAFFGYHSGLNNTTGDGNVFIGEQTGLSNTKESNNTLIGARANGSPDISNATAIGFRAKVTQSNSIVLGSIAGINGASENVKVGIGTSAPLASLHIGGDSGKAQLLVKENSKIPQFRNMFELNNLGPVQFHMINRRSGVDWTFRNNWRREFTIQTDPVTIIQFALNRDGDLSITGDLNANGVFYSSDRNRKENFSSVDNQQVLQKLISVPISEWNFKKDNIRHIGPMAQDFYTAFEVGRDNKHLNPTDTAGVNMAAIQGLYQRLLEKDRIIADLEARVAKLEKNATKIDALLDRLSKLEKSVTR